MDELIQVAGSLLILGAFVLAQRGRVHPRSVTYLVLNAAGSGALAVEATLARQWGFLLLEGVWAALSVSGLAAALRRRSLDVH